MGQIQDLFGFPTFSCAKPSWKNKWERLQQPPYGIEFAPWCCHCWTWPEGNKRHVPFSDACAPGALFCHPFPFEITYFTLEINSRAQIQNIFREWEIVCGQCKENATQLNSTQKNVRTDVFYPKLWITILLPWSQLRVTQNFNLWAAPHLCIPMSLSIEWCRFVCFLPFLVWKKGSHDNGQGSPQEPAGGKWPAHLCSTTANGCFRCIAKWLASGPSAVYQGETVVFNASFWGCFLFFLN